MSAFEPDGAGGRLAHLGAGEVVSSGVVSAKSCGVHHAVAEIDAVDDVAPLVGAAHLQPAAVALVQLHEVVGLQDHVVEFEEGQRLLAVEPQLHLSKDSMRLTEKCRPTSRRNST
jgi:hypothetical protein